MKALKRGWRVCRALMNIYAVGVITAIVGIFSNEEAKEKMVSLLSDQFGELQLAWRDFRHPAN